MDQTEKKLRHRAVDLFEESKVLKRDIIKDGKASVENLVTEKTDIINKLENLKVIVKLETTDEMNAVVTYKIEQSKAKAIGGNESDSDNLSNERPSTSGLPKNPNRWTMPISMFSTSKIIIHENLLISTNSLGIQNTSKMSDKKLALKNSPNPARNNLEDLQTKTTSRTERIKRKLLKVPEDQTFVTDFFPYLDEFKENCMNIKILDIQKSESSGVNSLLELLAKTATINNNEKSKGNRYETSLKKFCCYLFLIGERMLYDTLYSNLNGAIPAISTIPREVTKNNNIEEGTPGMKELRKSLQKLKLPQIVWLSKDRTRINGRATSVQEIKRQFEDEVVANYACVLVAQPLKKSSSSFCYSVYGTNNKFKSEDVLRRRKTTLTMAENQEIKILGTSSDRDNRLLKTMKYVTKLSIAKNP
ncbi:hypothetical protein FQR65_LT02325 [Abscondita terminalis]|nr:hypothetical protein FQR65_LT02325 [Abscondita terminalis]